jgi:hypothetical protein
MNIGVPFHQDEMEVVWKSVNFLKYILDSETEMTYKRNGGTSFFCFLLSDGGNYFQRRQQFHESDVQTGRNCFCFLTDLANILPKGSVEFYAERQSITTRHLSSVVKTLQESRQARLLLYCDE